MSEYLKQLRREASRRGILWASVRAAYESLREGELQQREREEEVRAMAWMIHTASTPKSWPFWRHGFLSKWGRRVDRSDYTAIRGYDGIHQQICGAFPEYAGPDGEWKLFAFLLSPYERRTPPAELWQQAFQWAIEQHQTAGVEDYADVPF